MTQLKRKAMLGGLFSTAMAATLYAGSTIALPSTEIEWTYYSDAAKTVEVGGKILTCSGRSYRWGTQTSYYTIYRDISCY